MTTSFPTGLDAFNNPDAATDDLNTAGVLHDEQHENANDAIEAIEAKVGVNSSAVTTSLDYRMGALEASRLGTLIVPLNQQADVDSVWSNMPAVRTRLFGSSRSRHQVDLTDFLQARLIAVVNVAGSVNAKLRGEYALDDASTGLAYLDGSTGPELSIASTGTRVSPWVNLAAAARADVIVHGIGIDGDGVADPVFGTIALQFRKGTPAAAAWTPYTPAWTADTTNPVLNNGTLEGAYRLDGKTVLLRIGLKPGSLTTFGSGPWSFSWPTGLSPKVPTGARQAGSGWAFDTSGALQYAVACFRRGNGLLGFGGPSGTLGTSSTVPFTWAQDDELSGFFCYELP